MESNATLTGAYIEWIIGVLCERSENPEKCRSEILDDLEEILRDVPPGSNETMTALGPDVMDCQKITDIPLARLYFPQPALPQVKSLDAASLIKSVFENIAYAVRGNVEQLNEFSECRELKTVGGTTKSRVWPEILANVTGKDLLYPVQSEGSLLGVAICAATGVGWHSSLEKSVKEMVQWHSRVNPDNRSAEYQTYYKRWKEIWIGCE
jgi:sugar (pentulose or hexulose) kinase